MATARVEWGDEVRVLARAVDQAGDVLDHVHRDALGRQTPCADWDLAALADHLVNAPHQFLTMMRGEEVHGPATPHVEEEWGPAFRVAGDDLVHAWHEHPSGSGGGDAPVPAHMQTAELAIHTWDVARTIGHPVAELDPEVAEPALASPREPHRGRPRSGVRRAAGRTRGCRPLRAAGGVRRPLGLTLTGGR